MASLVTRSSSLLWSKIKHVPVQYPMTFGVILSGFKTSFSDILVQKVVERRDEIDWKRNAAFASFGFFYLGGVQYTIYVPIFGRLFPNAAKFAAKSWRDKLADTKGMMHVMAQTFLDQCVHHPLMYFPAFYCTRELVMQKEPNLYRVLFQDYRKNFKEDLVALWKVWVPATIFNFAFMPMHLRIPFVAGVSLLWTCILSAMRGGDVVHGEEMAGGAVTGKTYSLLQEGLDVFNISPVELDSDLTHVHISATGKNQPGLVSLLTRHIANQGGNVTHSKMVRLGDEFVIQMHIAIPPTLSYSTFYKSLRQNKDITKHFPQLLTTKLNKRKTTDAATYRAVMGFKLHCVGKDRPGMLAAVADKMASKGMSIENVSTSLRLSKNGEREFVIDAMVTSSRLADAENLDECMNDIATLKQELNLTHFDVFVHTEKI